MLNLALLILIACMNFKVVINCLSTSQCTTLQSTLVTAIVSSDVGHLTGCIHPSAVGSHCEPSQSYHHMYMQLPVATSRRLYVSIACVCVCVVYLKMCTKKRVSNENGLNVCDFYNRSSMSVGMKRP